MGDGTSRNIRNGARLIFFGTPGICRDGRYVPLISVGCWGAAARLSTDLYRVTDVASVRTRPLLTWRGATGGRDGFKTRPLPVGPSSTSASG